MVNKQTNLTGKIIILFKIGQLQGHYSVYVFDLVPYL